MSDVTQILIRLEQGDPSASEQLLPLVYEELRKLAASRLANEKPGQTLQATALVHEAYLRLLGDSNDQNWSGRGHFFGAAAEAMRRILVERARSRAALKRGGGMVRREFDEGIQVEAKSENFEQILAINEALDKLNESDKQAAELVKLRYFGGLTLREAAAALEVPSRTADRIWAYARSWLLHELDGKSRR